MTERDAYAAATHWFLATAPAAAGRWDEPGLDQWTVRDLVGHTSRSLVTVETYLAAEPGEVTLASAADYYRSIGAALSDDGVVERGRAAGRALGDDPQAFLADLAGRVLARVDAAPDDAFVGTPFGGLRLIDYLPTRTFELVVHTADLQRALGGTFPPPPRESLASALRLATELVIERDLAVDLLLALTGRKPLASDVSLM